MKNNAYEKIMAGCFPAYHQITASNEEKLIKKQNNFWDNLSSKEKYKINYLLLKQEGKKKFNYLYCSEPGRLEHHEDILDYETVYDFDKSNWDYQERCSLADIKQDKKALKKGKEHVTEQSIAEAEAYHSHHYAQYTYTHGGDWIRWIEGKQLYYGEIVSAHLYIKEKVEQDLNKLIARQIPHMFWNPFGEPKPKKIGKELYTYSLGEIRAAGREKELEEIEQWARWFILNKLPLEITQALSQYSGMTFRHSKKSNKPWKGFDSLIIADAQAAEQVHIKTLLQDFREREQPIGILKNIISQINMNTVYPELLRQLEKK
jgi:hypothetical protein